MTAPTRRSLPLTRRAEYRHVGPALTLPAILAVAIAVIATVLLGEDPYEAVSLGYPGEVVTVATTALTAGAKLFSLVAVGALVHVAFLRSTPPPEAEWLTRSFEMRLLRPAATVWAVCAAGLIPFEALDANGLGLSRLTSPSAFFTLYTAADAPRAWTISLLAALLVLAGSTARRWTGLLVPLCAATVGVLAPVVVGHVLVGPGHDLGSDAAVFQTVAVHALFGPLLVAATRIATGRGVPATAIRRVLGISALALPTIVATDLLLAWFTLAGTGFTTSLTGWAILARWVCLLLLTAALAVLARRWHRGTLQGHATPLLGIMAGAVLGWVVLAVIATRAAPPHFFVDTSIQQVFMGFEINGPPTPFALLTQWRPNLLFLGVAVVAVTGYLLAVRSLRRRGDHWPWGRTVAWILGWIVVVVVTSSGLGRYSAPDFGIHMVGHMSLNMLAPVLLVLGGVATLLLRSTRARKKEPAGPHEWLRWTLLWPGMRWVYQPLLVFVVFVGSYYVLYLTPLFELAIRFHWAHQLMNVHFLLIGYLYYGLIVGVDRVPHQLPHIGRLGMALAAMPFHAFFAIVLMMKPDIIAETFYRYLDLPWADLAARQYVGGGVAWAGGEIPLLLVVLALSIQWSRQDARESRRRDRHEDRGHDTEFDAYNEMLQRLAERDRATPTPASATRDEGRES